MTSDWHYRSLPKAGRGIALPWAGCVLGITVVSRHDVSTDAVWIVALAAMLSICAALAPAAMGARHPQKLRTIAHRFGSQRSNVRSRLVQRDSDRGRVDPGTDFGTFTTWLGGTLTACLRAYFESCR